MIVAVVGNPFEGLEIYGPFEESEDATSWCERLDYEEWNIVVVEKVNDQHMGKTITDLMEAHSDCPLDNGNGNVLEKILDLCQEHGLVDEAMNELHCIEENGCRSSQM